MSNAQTLHTAMTDLRKGRITPDEFRAIVRASKQQHGQAAHEQARNTAIAATNR